MKRQFTPLDLIIREVNSAMTTLCTDLKPSRDNPSSNTEEADLTESEKKHIAGLMRVNHVGEVCAQALYQGQAFVAKDEKIKAMLQESGNEEVDHLAWTHQRLKELNSRRSYLNAFWYGNSFAIGALAGLAGDGFSLGFVEETEAQVSDHLAGHLGQIPEKDQKSLKIVAKMKDDEERHGANANALGAHELPTVVKFLMRAHAKVMTTIAYWV